MKYIRSFEENEQRLVQVIAAEKRRKDYKEAVKKYKFWKQIVTGENQDEHILKFRPNESEQQKRVRLNAYNPLTPYLVEKVKTIYSEADRSNKVDYKEYFDPNESEDSINKFNQLKEHFNGERSARAYVKDNFLDRVILDQNSYEVIEYKTNEDGIIDTIYPKYYNADKVVDDYYFNGWLQYVVVVDIETIVKKSGEEERPKYTMYCPDYKIIGFEVDEEVDSDLVSYQNGDLARGYFVEVKGKLNKPIRLYFEEIKTFSKRVPAIRYELTRCQEYEGLFESVLRPAKGIFKDNIQKKANYDTIMKAHGIYRTFARVPRCNYRNQTTGQVCKNGRLTTGEICPACQGTGKTKLHDSELDVITFPIENDIDPKERVNLQDMIYTETIDTTLIELYDAQVDKSETRISLALFNTNIFDRKELLAGTATEIRAQFKNVNNKLYKYEVAKARILKFIYEQIAIYSDINTDEYYFDVSVPSDFDLETIDDLLEMLDKAKNSNAPQHFINEISRKIINLEYEDDPETALEIESFEKFKPFSDISENERISIVTLLDENDPIKIKYVYYSEIVKKIKNSKELKYIDDNNQEQIVKVKFWEIPYELQERVFEYYASEFYRDVDDTFEITTTNE